MNITSILNLTIASVVFSSSAHAVEIFSVQATTNTYPTTTAALFAGSEYDIYDTTDVGNGSGWGSAVNTNFNGANSWTISNGTITKDSIVNPGEQSTASGSTSTYFGPKFYGGINRDLSKGAAGVIHMNGNGYRIRVNNITASDIGTAQVGVEGDSDYAPATGNGGNGINFKAVFMFDADTSSLTEGDGFLFGESDTFVAKLGAANNMGPGTGAGSVNRASSATYRPMVKADGEYYAGPLYAIDVSALSGANSSTFDVTNTGASSSWTLMPDMEKTNGLVQTDPNHPRNLSVDTSGSATVIAGTAITNITQVGFLLETTGEVNTGGYNYGVRQFSANATAANAPEPAPDLIPWSEDFSGPVEIIESSSSSGIPVGLTGDGHAGKFVKYGSGLSDPASTSDLVFDEDNDRLVITLGGTGSGNAVKIQGIGQGTNEARRVKPVDHETTWVVDLISFRQAQADLSLKTRGLDGSAQVVLSPSGTFKFSTWHADYQHSGFASFSGPTSVKSSGSNGITVTDGGVFDGTGGVTVTISNPETDGGVTATADVVMSEDLTTVTAVNVTDGGSGYTSVPTVTFSGGGVSVQPSVTIRYQTGNVNNNNTQEVSMGDIFTDGDTLTVVQSYSNADDSISYYYGINGAPANNFITTLTAADDSANGYGFYNVTTGNKYTTPEDQQSLFLGYQAWNDSNGVTPQIALRSFSVEFTDSDGDGVINREDLFPDDDTESLDTDGDGVGDNSDVHPGYNDAELATYLNDNNYILDDGNGGGISQEVYDAVVAEKVAAEAAQASAEAAQAAAEAALAATPTLLDIQDLRAGSTMISVSEGSAIVSLQMEESSDLSSWSDLGAAIPFTVTLDPGDDTQFFRVKLAD